MRGFRNKLIFACIIYVAGFATAIYCLAPAPDESPNSEMQATLFKMKIKSNDFAQSFNTGLHKSVGFGKEVAKHAGKVIREKYDAYQDRQHDQPQDMVCQDI